MKKDNWKAAALTLLCIAAAAAMSLSSATMCKYTASAGVTAGARVAAWKHGYAGAIYANNAKARTLNGAIGSDSSKLYTSSVPCGTITNNSEVAVDYRLYVYAYNTDDAAARTVAGPDEWGANAADTDITSFGAVSCTGGTPQGDNTWRVAPGGTAAFSIVFERRNTNRTYRCRAYIRAVQVD